MKIASALSLIAAAGLLQGCWFIFIPGSVVSAVGDAMTGAEGQNCVAGSAKVGDIVTTVGGPATVKSLSGTTARCTDPRYPVRALLDYSTPASTK